MSNAPTPPEPRSLRITLLAYFALAALGCSAVAPTLAKVAGSLLSTISGNYGQTQSNNMSDLIEAILFDDLAEKIKGKIDGISEPDPAQPAPEPIALDVALLRQAPGGAGTLPIADGDVLQTGDRFRIKFRADRNCFVYIIGIDGSGWASPAFPSGGWGNPVQAGREYDIPEAWFRLDDYVGVEHIYFIASNERRTDIEGQLQTILAGQEQILGRGARPSSAESAVVQEAYVVNRSAPPKLIERGLGEDLQSFVSKPGQGSVAFTRYFVHR